MSPIFQKRSSALFFDKGTITVCDLKALFPSLGGLMSRSKRWRSDAQTFGMGVDQRRHDWAGKALFWHRIPAAVAGLSNLIRTAVLTDVAPENAIRYYACMKPKGLFRERNGWDDQHSVVSNTTSAKKSRYRDRGYQPPFDELPWKDDPTNDA
jgi:hypothetical protein